MGDILDLSSVCWAREPASSGVTDETSAIFVNGRSRDDNVVLLVSGPAFPDAVEKDVARAKAIADLLDDVSASHVIRPRLVGRWGAQSYAVLPRLKPMSPWRAVRYARRRRLAPQISAWLAQIARATMRTYADPGDYAAYFIAPLASIADDPDFSGRTRDAAGRYLAHVEAHRPELFTVAQHRDLWIGNIFFRLRTETTGFGARGDFCVIDWGGARVDGYPAGDMLHFTGSVFRRGSRRADRVVWDYAERVGLTPFEMGLYAALGVGSLGLDLDQFPKARYIELAEDVFFRSARLGFDPKTVSPDPS